MSLARQNIFESHELPLPPYFGWLQPHIFHLFCVNSSIFHHFPHFSHWKSPSKRRGRGHQACEGLRTAGLCLALELSAAWAGQAETQDGMYATHLITSLSISIYMAYIYIHLYCIYYLVLYIYTLKYICTYIYIYVYIYMYIYIFEYINTYGIVYILCTLYR